MEAIRINCAGFPTKKPFAEFIKKFGLLAPEVLDGRYFGCFYLLHVRCFA
jgi:myosin-5